MTTKLLLAALSPMEEQDGASLTVWAETQAHALGVPGV